MLRPWCALAVVATVSARSPALAQPRSITLTEALRRAESVDPQVVQAQGAVRNAGASVRTAYGGYLPSVSTSANFSNSYSQGESRVDPVTGEVISGSGSSTGLNFGANASYDLFTGFRRGKDIGSAKAQRSAGEAAYDPLPPPRPRSAGPTRPHEPGIPRRRPKLEPGIAGPDILRASAAHRDTGLLLQENGLQLRKAPLSHRNLRGNYARPAPYEPDNTAFNIDLEPAAKPPCGDTNPHGTAR